MNYCVDYIKDTFNYVPDKGVILNRLTGKQVGFLWTDGNLAYMKVSVREGSQVHKYQSARMAYTLVTGEPLKSSVVISYKDGDPTNLKWDNLVFSDKSSVASSWDRADRPKYEPTNHPHVFRGVHNGVYVVRRWNPGEYSTLAVLRFPSFDLAVAAVDLWLETRKGCSRKVTNP